MTHFQVERKTPVAGLTHFQVERKTPVAGLTYLQVEVNAPGAKLSLKLVDFLAGHHLRFGQPLIKVDNCALFDESPQGFRGQSIVPGSERVQQIGGLRHEFGILEHDMPAIFRRRGPDRNHYLIIPVHAQEIETETNGTQTSVDVVENPANPPVGFHFRHQGRNDGARRVRLQRRDDRFRRGRIQRRDEGVLRIRHRRNDGFLRTVQKRGLGDFQTVTTSLVDEGFFKTCRDQAVEGLPVNEYGQGQFDIPVGEIVIDLERRKRLRSRLRFFAHYQVGLGEYGNAEVEAPLIKAQVRGRDLRRLRHEPRRRITRQPLCRYAVDAMHALPDPLHFLSQEQTVRESFVDLFLHASQKLVQVLLGSSFDAYINAENFHIRAGYTGAGRRVGIQTPVALKPGLQRQRRVNRQIGSGAEGGSDQTPALDLDTAGYRGTGTDRLLFRGQGDRRMVHRPPDVFAKEQFAVKLRSTLHSSRRLAVEQLFKGILRNVQPQHGPGAAAVRLGRRGPADRHAQDHREHENRRMHESFAFPGFE